MRIRLVAIGTLLLLCRGNGGQCRTAMIFISRASPGKRPETSRERSRFSSASFGILHPTDRSQRRALLQLGQWSDLLGQDESRKYYERIVREFADQTNVAAEARKRLDVLDSGRPADTHGTPRQHASGVVLSTRWPPGGYL